MRQRQLMDDAYPDVSGTIFLIQGLTDLLHTDKIIIKLSFNIFPYIYELINPDVCLRC